MFKSHFEELKIDTHKLHQSVVADIRWQNITGEVECVVAGCNAAEGIVVVQTKHTTAGLVLNEDEKGLIENDLPKVLARIIPQGGDYKHDDAGRLLMLPPGEPKNGPGHLRSILGAMPSLTLIIHDSRLQLGTWQSILFFDFDPLSHPGRLVDIQVLGLTC